MATKKTKKKVSPTDVENLSFNDIPRVLGEVLGSLQHLEERTSKLEGAFKRAAKINKIEQRVAYLERRKNTGNTKWLSVEQLIAYVPSHPTKQTVYAWMRDNKIPYYRGPKECHFLITEIDSWLLQNPNLATDNLKSKAEEYIKSHPIKK